MPKRRNVLLGVGALIAGGGAVLGTGAFTTVEAERIVNVETAGDVDAFLALDTIDDSANSAEFAEINDDGVLTVTIDGVNLNAITHIDRVFQVTNNGSDPVTLYIEEDPGETTLTGTLSTPRSGPTSWPESRRSAATTSPVATASTTRSAWTSPARARPTVGSATGTSASSSMSATRSKWASPSTLRREPQRRALGEQRLGHRCQRDAPLEPHSLRRRRRELRVRGRLIRTEKCIHQR